MRSIVGVLALAVAACVGPTSENVGAAPSIPPGAMCGVVPPGELPPISALETHGRIGQRTIYATPGQLACSEPALGAVDCFARPGRTIVRIEGAQETKGFILEGQEALRIGPENVICVPPTDGPTNAVATQPQLDMNEIHAAISAEAQRLYGSACGQVRVPERAIEAVELTGGGQAEYVLFLSRVECAADGGATTRWQGADGEVVQFWLASGGAPRMLLERAVLGFSPTGSELITHQPPSSCRNGASLGVCEVIYIWNAQERSLEVASRTALENSAEIDRRAAALRFHYRNVSRR